MNTSDLNTTPRFKLRHFQNDDYSQVHLLWQECGLQIDMIDIAANLAAKSLERPGSIIVAECDHRIVGTVLITFDGWMPLIFRLAVAARFRKFGIGESLMRAAEQQLLDWGSKGSAIFVDADSKSLLDWYQKQGYESVPKKFECLIKHNS